MKKQMVIRTYPDGAYTYNDVHELQAYLNNGWLVIMSNKFQTKYGTYGNEYILEKDVD